MRGITFGESLSTSLITFLWIFFLIPCFFSHRLRFASVVPYRCAMNLCVEPFFLRVFLSLIVHVQHTLPRPRIAPGLTPCFLFATSASLVRCEMRSLKMSAVIENAIATIFD